MAAHPVYRALLRRHVTGSPSWRPRLRQRNNNNNNGSGQQQNRTQSTDSGSGSGSGKKPDGERRGGGSGSGAAEETEVPTPNNVPQLPFWQRLGPFTRAAEAYARAQRTRPLVTQVATTLVIYFVADNSAQRMGGKDYDPARTGRSLLIGAIAAIPSFKWFMFLSHNFNYASRILSLATKVVINQLCFTPIFNSYFFGMQALLAGEGLDEVAQRIRRTVPVSFVNSLKLWPAVTAFSFTFVPIEYRSLFAGVIAVGWQTYLSFLNRRAEQEEEAAREREPGRQLVAIAEAAV